MVAHRAHIGFPPDGTRRAVDDDRTINTKGGECGDSMRQCTPDSVKSPGNLGMLIAVIETVSGVYIARCMR